MGMNQRYSRKQSNFIAPVFVLALTLLACTLSGTVSTPTLAPVSVPTDVLPTIEAAPATQIPGSTPATQPSTGSHVVINGNDPCGLLTKEQVEAGFGKSVAEVKPEQTNIGRECEYIFGEDNDLRITFYEGENAANYFAVLITAAGQSCDEFFEVMFDIAVAPLTEKYPSADQSLLSLPLGDLYRQYIVMLGNCMYIHNQDRADMGGNVVATETIFMNWTSNLAVLDTPRVVEFTYQEIIPDDTLQILSAGTDKESFYALADPYRQQVLSPYTEILIGLLKQTIGR
jgi:hypothetical protein